jgi:hypothetical protein
VNQLAAPVAAPALPFSLPETRPEVKDSTRRSFDEIPIIYHGQQLWPRVDDLKDPNAADYPTREDVEVAYRLAVDYLRRIRTPRGPDPKVDAMEHPQDPQASRRAPGAERDCAPRP